MNKEQLNRVYDYLDAHQDEMTSVLEEVVNIESYAREADNVNRVAAKFKALFEAEGFRCELVDVGANGPTLLGVLGEERPGKPAIFSGHMDTVIKTGTYETPVFRREGNKAYGPGVLDMKGGIVISLFVTKALNAAGFCDRPLKIAFSGDEEIGHQNSRGAEVLREAAMGGACAFNLETGILNNTLCYGRKGRMESFATVSGVESHAGNDFSRGRNAIEEMAHKIIEIQALTNLEKGTTVTCATISGGTVTNAIPKECVLGGECRFDTVEEMENYKKKVEEICAKTFIEGTTTQVKFMPGFAPFECTDQVMGFWKFICETAEECGLEKVNGKKVGGSSDASYIQMAGTPVICSVGIQGEWNHTTREYALLDSMSPRGKLIASVILNLDKFESQAQ
jgi:glutamate carboxypeptidase